MPILDPEETTDLVGLGNRRPRPIGSAPAPNFSDLVGGAWDELSVNLYRDWRDHREAVAGIPEDPNYDPFGDIGGYEDFADRFTFSRSAGETWRIKLRIDRERERNQMLADGGLLGVATQIGVGILDPVNLIPFGGVAYRGAKAARPLLSSVAEGALAGAGGAAVYEAIAQGTTETRTEMDALFNIGAGTLLGGILGGAVGLVRGGVVPTTLDAMEAGLRADFEATAGRSVDGGRGGLSAQSVVNTTLADEGVKGALGAERLLTVNPLAVDPVAKLLESPSVATRRIIQDLAEVPLRIAKNVQGLASSIAAETRARLWYAPLADALRAVDDNFIRYKMGRERGTGDVLRAGVADAIGATGGKMTRLQFAEAVGRAMRREDADPVPEVAAAAREMRVKIFDPLKNEAIRLGLLPEDVTPETAASYLSRVYDKPRIAAQRPEFENRLTEWLTGIQKQSEAKQAEAQANLDRAVADRDRYTEDAKIDVRDAELRLDKARLDFVATDRELKLRDRRFRGLMKSLKAAAERAEKLSPDAKLAPDDAFKVLMQDVRRKPREPESLAKFLRRMGGLRESAGELKAMDAAKALPGLVNNKGGLTLDDAAQLAWENGYFGPMGARDRPDINELLDALRDDIGGSPTYSIHDDDTLAAMDAAAAMRKELDERGIDYSRMSDEEVLARFEDRAFKADTAVRREKVRETARQASRTRDMLDREAKELKDVQAKWDALRSEIDTTTGELTRGRAAKQALKRAETKAERAAARLEMERWTANASDAELRDVSRQITDQILGNAEARTSYLPFAVKTRGPLMERTLLIPDLDIEDFLESDIFRVARFYTRTMGTDVELTRSFGRADMADQIDTINEDYAIQRARLKDGDEKAFERLEARRMDDIRTLEGIRDRVRGQYGMPRNPDGVLIRAGRTMRNLNYVRLLGGATVSSLSDMARAVTVHGFRRSLADGLLPMVTNLRGYKLAAKEARMAAAAIENELDMRAQMMADIWDDYGRGTMLERGLSQMSSTFGNVSLLGPWTDFWKRFSAVLSQSRTIDSLNAKAAGSASKAEIERMAFLGLSDEMQDRIAAQLAAHGKDEGGLRYANSGAWDDVEAVTAFRAAILKESNLAIIQPGQEKPLWMSTQMGAFIGQFRSFTFSAMTRVTVAGLQQRDSAALGGIVLSVGLGMMAYAAKAWIAGKELSDDPNKWVLEGFDNSGVTGWVFEANNILDKVSGGGFSLQGAMGTELERYRARSPLEVLLGPSAGAASNVGEVFNSALGSGEWTESDTRRVRQLLPYQNVFYLRWLFDEMESGVNNATGIEETDQ